jgi:lipopolysaccharide/colanic/teichoic acid biosynthesis glycosyltransferase
MRWMESLVERAGAGGGIPTIQRLWSADRYARPDEQIGHPSETREPLSRSVNLLLALVALILLFPLLVLIAVIVWLSTPGPILYTQVRVGLDRRVPLDPSQNHRRERNLGGLPFTIYKFRTIFAELREHIAEYPLRQRAKPGITGLAQINHHYDRSLDDVRTKVRYDLEYIRRQSFFEDFRIMLKTLPVILLRRGGW